MSLVNSVHIRGFKVDRRRPIEDVEKKAETLHFNPDGNEVSSSGINHKGTKPGATNAQSAIQSQRASLVDSVHARSVKLTQLRSWSMFKTDRKICT